MGHGLPFAQWDTVLKRFPVKAGAGSHVRELYWEVKTDWNK